MDAETQFSKLRSFFWPVHRSELRKVVPMLLLFFLVSLNYQLLKNVKDAVVVTASSSGAEVIPFIKVWVMLPAAILATYLFTLLSKHLRGEQIFYIIISSFLVYFAFFALYLFPHQESLALNDLADHLALVLPKGFKGLVTMCRHWVLTSFYVMAELWSSMALSVLFWGFANQITRVGEAKRFYGIFGLAANLSGVVAAKIGLFFFASEFNPAIPLGTNHWEQALEEILLLVIITGFVILAIYHLLHRYPPPNTPAFAESNLHYKQKKKKHMSFRATLAYLAHSRYAMCIAFIVVAYNLVMNLLEVIWKEEVRMQYPNPADFASYMNHVGFWIGCVATLLALVVTSNSIRILGWTKTALITPMIILLTSVGFFSLIFFQDNISLLSILHLSPLALITFIGSTQNVLSRACKYTVFDSTKELAFIPLSQEEKLKAKAAIDGIGSRFGKSGGSILHQGMLFFCGSLSASAPYIAVFLLAIVMVWIVVTRSLGKQFLALSISQSTHDENVRAVESTPEIVQTTHKEESKAT